MQPPRFGQPAQKPGLWRRTPPALFTPVFGLFGLAAAWRRAADAFAAPPWPGELLFGAVTLLYLFLLVAYGAKVARRPAVVAEDLRVLPGRAGLAAMSLGGMLMALGFIHLSPALAQTVLALAIGLHAILLVLVLRALLRGPAEARRVTPVWHLTFAGFIVSPLAAMPLGWTAWSQAAFWGSLAAAVAIWAVSLVQFLRQDVPAPLRPLLAIHLAPASLLGTVALLIGQAEIALGFGLFAGLLLALLVLRARWVTAAGFSPLWGAFTFPLAAFAGLYQLLGAAGQGEAFRIIGGLALVAATLMIPAIAWKVVQMWGKGTLAAKTNAAQV